MGPVLYRLRCQLRARWRTAASLAVVVTVVGAVVLTIVAGAVRTLSAPDRYSSWRGRAYDVSIEQQKGKPRTAEMAALPAVGSVETATFVFGGLQSLGGGDSVDALVFAGTQAAFGTRLVEGREPDRSNAHEFAATRSFLDETGAEIGDEFRLVTIAQAQADALGFDAPDPAGPTLTATLVGVIDGPAVLQDGYPSYALFSSALLDVGDVGVSATFGVVSLESGATADDLRAQLDGLPDGEVFSLDQAEWVPGTVRDAVHAQGQGLAVVAIIVAVTSIAVVGQLLSRQVAPSEAQRLAMSSVGFSRTQLVADPLCFATVAVLAGSIGASAVAFAVSGVFPVGFVKRVEPHAGPMFEPLVHGIGPVLLTVPLGIWVLISLALRSRRITAIRSARFVEGLAPRIRPVQAAIGVRFAFGRQPREPATARASLVGLVLVLGVLVGTLTFSASLSRLLDEPARYGEKGDLMLGVGGSQIPDDVRAALQADPDVAAVTLYGTVTASVGAASLDVTGMQSLVGDLEPDLVSGRLPVRDDEIALGRVAGRDLGIGVGDDLVVTGAAGPRPLHVTGLAIVPSVEGGDGIGQGGLVTFSGLQAIDPSATLSTAMIELRPDARADAAQHISEITGMTAGGPGDPPSAIVNLARIRSIPWIVVAMLGLLAGLTVAHQLTLSAQRRRRDVAVLRSLGADDRWVAGLVHWQATVFTTVVLVLAVPIGLPAGRSVFRIFADRIGAQNDIAVPYAWLAATLLPVVVLANVLVAFLTRHAAARRPARILAHE